MQRLVLLACGLLSGCAALVGREPVGSVQGVAPSRYQGTPLAIVGDEEVVEPAAPQWGSYTVLAGDTMYSLARKHGLSVKELADLNGIQDPTAVRVGTVLKVPVPAGSVAVAPKKAAPVMTPSAANRRYPLRWPVDGQVTSRYGARAGKGHDGIDIGAPEGTQVFAAAPGQVVFSAPHGGYGNLVVLRHDDGLVTVYAHHSQNLVRKGQQVSAGQVIAKVGTTGRSTGPHLHFEVRKGAVPQNPLRFLPP